VDSGDSGASIHDTVHVVRACDRRAAADPRTRIIGITFFDMFIEEMRGKWEFAFSLRSDDRRLAVISYARLDPAALGASPDDELMRSRLRKMVAKNIGIMCYGLRTTNNPRSVRFGNVLGVDDLDRMTEEFDPK
jgi:predicted Zn-dependent protease